MAAAVALHPLQNLLRDIRPLPSGDAPDIEMFELLLKRKVDIFFPTRTARTLLAHWDRLKVRLRVARPRPTALRAAGAGAR